MAVHHPLEGDERATDMKSGLGMGSHYGHTSDDFLDSSESEWAMFGVIAVDVVMNSMNREE